MTLEWLAWEAERCNCDSFSLPVWVMTSIKHAIIGDSLTCFRAPCSYQICIHNNRPKNIENDRNAIWGSGRSSQSSRTWNTWQRTLWTKQRKRQQRSAQMPQWSWQVIENPCQNYEYCEYHRCWDNEICRTWSCAFSLNCRCLSEEFLIFINWEMQGGIRDWFGTFRHR